MARSLSPEKRHALLQSAVHQIATTGLAASTSSIAKGAGLAEGTLFTYFPNKEALLNELYIELKTDAYNRLNTNFPHTAPLRTRAQHIWTEYLHWAIEKPNDRKASVLLNLSTVITAATKERVNEQSGPVARTIKELSQRGAFKTMPPGFAASAMLAMQEAVMETAARKPSQRTQLIESAFGAFWKMAR